MKRKPPAVPKKPYQAPKLTVYGDLTEMTKATGNMGQLDGGKASKRKTGA